MPPRLSNWSFPASLAPPWCLAGCPISPVLPPWCLPHRLSNWSFPASLVPPWCLAGCLTSPFLPPWCLPGACQAVHMVLSCRRPAGVCPLASGLPSAKQISILGWALRPVSRSTEWPLKGRSERPWRRIAFRRLFVAQTLLLRPQRFVLTRAGHPTRKP